MSSVSSFIKSFISKRQYRRFENSHARAAPRQFRAAYSIIPVGTDTATSFNYHKRKTDGKVLSPLSAYIFLYLILPIAHKEVRRVVPAVRMLAYRHRHCGIGLCQNISPMPLAKKPYRFFANSHARVAQQQFRTAYRIDRSSANLFRRTIVSCANQSLKPHTYK